MLCLKHMRPGLDVDMIAAQLTELNYTLRKGHFFYETKSTFLLITVKNWCSETGTQTKCHRVPNFQ